MFFSSFRIKVRQVFGKNLHADKSVVIEACVHLHSVSKTHLVQNPENGGKIFSHIRFFLISLYEWRRHSQSTSHSTEVPTRKGPGLGLSVLNKQKTKSHGGCSGSTRTLSRFLLMSQLLNAASDSCVLICHWVMHSGLLSLLVLQQVESWILVCDWMC